MALVPIGRPRRRGFPFVPGIDDDPEAVHIALQRGMHPAMLQALQGQYNQPMIGT